MLHQQDQRQASLLFRAAAQSFSYHEKADQVAAELLSSQLKDEPTRP